MEDNVEGQRDKDLRVDLQHADLRARLTTLSNIKLAYDRIAPNWGEESRNLFSIELRSTPLQNWRFTGYYSTGQDVTLGENTDFLDGLRLPVISLAETRHTSAALTRAFPARGELQLLYKSATGQQRLSLASDAGSVFGANLQTRTEVGWNFDDRQVFAEHRTEYLLPGFVGSRLQLQARYERESWSVGLYVTFQEVFRNDALPPRRIRGSRFDPESGCITGSVFVDTNANTVRDPGEPGLPNVKVLLDG